MRGKILGGLVVLLLLYGVLVGAERLTTQELKRVLDAGSGEAVCLMWRPRLLRGDGICSVDLVDARGGVVDSARLGTLDTAFNALQRYGSLDFQDGKIKAANLQTGDGARRFVVRDGRLTAQD